MNKLENATVVVAARQFNPSVFGELFLVRNNIFSEVELASATEKLFSDTLSVVRTDKFVLSVLPLQMQFAIDEGDAESGSIVIDKFQKLLDLVPHTPFLGAGVNFHWRIAPSTKTIGDFEREVFVAENGPFSEFFSSSDSRFGGYFSTNVFDCRLKLSISPVTTEEEDSVRRESLLLVFNYHLDINQGTAGVERVDSIKRHFANWRTLLTHSQEIAEKATKRGE